MLPIYVGIDLGSTYSSIAWCNPQTNRPEVLPNAEGELSTPSIVLVEPGGNMIVGSPALSVQYEGDNAKRTVRMIKRNMGTNWKCFPNKPYTKTPEEISAAILKKLVDDAARFLGVSKIDGAVITVPAYYDNDPRVATMKAAQIAGIEVKQLLDEPVASAIVFGVENLKHGERILVYDLGGGTFDASILEKQNNKLKVLRSQGSRKLGGYDWTNLLKGVANRQYLKKYVSSDEDEDFLMEELLSGATLIQEAQFEEQVEQAKQKLSEENEILIEFFRNKQKEIIRIDRRQFEQATKSLVQQTIEKCEQLLKSVSLWWSNLDYVLLVGRSTRMPMIAEAINNFTQLTRPVTVFHSPDLIVAKGAALQAQGYLNSIENIKYKEAEKTTLAIASKSKSTTQKISEMIKPIINKSFKKTITVAFNKELESDVLKENDEIPQLVSSIKEKESESMDKLAMPMDSLEEKISFIEEPSTETEIFAGMEKIENPPDIIYLPGYGDDVIRLGTILTTAHPLGTIIISKNYRYMVSHIIPAGKIYPLRMVRHDYQTQAYTTNFVIPIVQGGIDGAEEGMAGDFHCCISKGTYRFLGIPSRATPTPIRVEFIYDRHQIIHVHAWDLLSNQSISSEKISEIEFPQIKRIPQSVVIALDCSGSMAGQEIEDAKLEIAKIVEAQLSEDSDSEIAIVTFGGPPQRYPSSILHNFTKNVDSLKEAISKIEASSTTPLAEGIELGIKILEGRLGTLKNINFVLISDGSPDNRKKAELAIEKLKQYPIKTFAIAIGAEADHKFLNQIGPSVHIERSCNLSRAISQFLFATN